MFTFRSSKQQISMLACEDTHIVMPGVRFLFSYNFARLACLEIFNSAIVAAVHAAIAQTLLCKTKIKKLIKNL